MGSFGPGSRNLKQVCTYWGPNVRGGDGEMTFYAPILLDCRWEGTETLIRNARGEEVTSTTQVYLDTDVAEEGYLGLGDQTLYANPDDTDARIVMAFQSIPDLRNCSQTRRAFL